MSTHTKQRGRRRRWPWIVLGGVLLLGLVAAAVLPSLLDIESYRGRIEEGLQSSTGWEAELGEMDFSVLRGMVLTVAPARLTAPGDGSRLDIERIQVKAELFPLLRGKLNVRRVELVGPDIDLVRRSEEEGWLLPVPAASESSDGEASEDSSFEISIDKVEVSGGALRLDDRIGDPPLRLDFRDLDLAYRPAAGSLSGRARLAGDEGEIEWKGDLENGMTLQLDGLSTDLLRPWTGPDLVHEGGRLTGTVRFALPLEIDGELSAEQLVLLEGTKPFEAADARFRIVTRDESWLLESLEFDGAGAKLTGAGTLSPALDLDLKLAPTPLDVALSAADSVLPLPVAVEPPGTVEATLRVDQPAGGELTYEALGSLSAAGFQPADMLPAARDVNTEFNLSRDGVLEVRVLDGRVGEGPLAGTARILSVSPPGQLVFEGGIQEAVLGQLLAGFVDDAGGRVTGPTGLTAAVGLDLSTAEIDARSLSGSLELDSRQVQMPGWDLEGAIRAKIDEKLGSLAALAGDRLSDGKDDAVADAAEVVEELFDSLEARVDFDSWPWRLERVAIAAGHLSTTGSGTFDPVEGRVDLSFTARLDPEETAKLVAKRSQLRVFVDSQGRLAVPLEIDGPLLAPSIGVDLGQALSLKLDTDSAEDAVKGLLKGLLDRKKKKGS